MVEKTRELLLAQQHKAVADFEGRYELHKGPMGTIGDIIEKNSILGSHLQSLSDGLHTLTQAIATNLGKDYNRIIQEVFREIKPIWSTSYGVFACGAYFLGLTGNDPAIMQYIDRQLEIEYLDDKNEVRAIFYGSSASMD
ncbi:MAG: hypothetical protein IPL46_01745 [Saprospiraceae bacterium]|nr:hypothetical protein [Saprospiraceae bacterium]